MGNSQCWRPKRTHHDTRDHPAQQHSASRNTRTPHHTHTLIQGRAGGTNRCCIVDTRQQQQQANYVTTRHSAAHVSPLLPRHRSETARARLRGTIAWIQFSLGIKKTGFLSLPSFLSSFSAHGHFLMPRQATWTTCPLHIQPLHLPLHAPFIGSRLGRPRPHPPPYQGGSTTCPRRLHTCSACA